MYYMMGEISSNNHLKEDVMNTYLPVSTEPNTRLTSRDIWMNILRKDPSNLECGERELLRSFEWKDWNDLKHRDRRLLGKKIRKCVRDESIPYVATEQCSGLQRYRAR